MKKILFFIIFFLLLGNSKVMGNTLTFKDKPLSNHSLVFHNLNTSVRYIVEPNELGRFSFPFELINDSSIGNLIEVVICPNLTKSDVHQGINIYCVGIRGYFPIIWKVENINIKVNSESMCNYIKNLKEFYRLSYFDENLYFCSLILSDNIRKDGIISYEEIFSNYTIKECIFKPLEVYNLDEGIYTISALVSDGPNVILEITNMEVKKINITNPYPEKKKAIIRSYQKGCYFENGKNETKEVFKPNETKEIKIISKEGIECNEKNTYIVYINPTINITIFGKITIVISIGIISIGALYFFYIKRRRRE